MTIEDKRSLESEFGSSEKFFQNIKIRLGKSTTVITLRQMTTFDSITSADKNNL